MSSLQPIEHLRMADRALRGIKLSASDVQELVQEIESLTAERDALKAAAKILKGCLDDAAELGVTVAVCGIDPAVLQAIQDVEEPPEQQE